MHAKEIEQVTQLPASKRYEYFIKRAADREAVWSLSASDGWATAADDDGSILLPFWPAPEYARLCATAEWQGYEPLAIELDVFRKRWIPGMQRDSRQAAIFPVPGDRGIKVPPARLENDLAEELTNYE